MKKIQPDVGDSDSVSDSDNSGSNPNRDQQNWTSGIHKKREKWLEGQNVRFPEGFSQQEHAIKTAQVLESWKAHLQTPGFHVLLDLDENLFDTFSYWVRLINRYLRLRFQLPFEQLPLATEVARYGGPSTYYPQFFPDIFSDDIHHERAFEHLAEEMRFRYNANRAGPPMIPAELSQFLEELAAFGQVLGGLTARPDVPAVRRATEKQTNNLFPVLYRSPEIPVQQASQEKLRILEFLTDFPQDSSEEILKETERLGCLVLVDDSLSTARTLGKANAQRLNQGEKRTHLPIQILNSMGPLTSPQLEQGNFSLEGLEGIFLMNSWRQLPELFQQIQLWREGRHFR